MDVVEKKEVVHKDVYDCDYSNNRHNYATKGVAGTGLGLGIAGTALGLWALGKNNIFGNCSGNCGNSPSPFQAWEKACDSELMGQKDLYEYALLSSRARFNDRERLNSELFGLYKSQADADFLLYKGQRDNYDVLADRIGKLETSAAVNAAVEPWRNKVLQMEIGNVTDLVNLEAERRMCADNKIVNYTNSTFYPVQVAQVEVGAGVTAKGLYNPLCDCHSYYNQSFIANK